MTVIVSTITHKVECFLFFKKKDTINAQLANFNLVSVFQNIHEVCKQYCKNRMNFDLVKTSENIFKE